MIAVCIVGLLAFAPTAPLLARRPLAASRCVTMAEIAAADVKSLRQKTGAGMMDCKVALKECDGDMDKAADMLRAKGLAAAGKRSSKATSEGLIEVYVHTGSRLGVMVELNCETDFVAKRPEFAALAKSVAMQIAASPTVEFVSVSDIPPEVIEAERVLEMQSEDLAGKPDEIKAKMVDGRLQKILKTKCLMETAYIKDPTQTMEVVVKSAISTLGENIKIARFSRMELGA